MVEGGVGVPWGADGHIREVELRNAVGGDRGRNGIVLPFLIRLGNKDSSQDKRNADHKKPKNLGCLGLKSLHIKGRVSQIFFSLP